MEFDDTTSSGIWWSTSVAIKDACTELKEDTNCSNEEIVNLLKSIAESILLNGI